MRKKTVALYDPYLDTIGGGEKHALSILKVLSEEGFDPVIFWDEDIGKKIENKLHLNIKEKLKFEKNIFKNPSFSTLQKMRKLSTYDVFIYMTDGSYFFSTAKKNVIFSLVPDKSLFNMTAMNKLKTRNAQFVTNSKFSQWHLKRWGITADVLYPYLESEILDFNSNTIKKDKIILSVGRFFKHLHAKRQDIMIEYFRKLKNEIDELKDYSLILVGGLRDEDKEYFNELKTMSNKDPSILLKPNVSYEELTNLYKKSEIYWHFAGYNVDENLHPEQTEHFGITPIEAMSYGCIPFCVNAGGLKETIQDSVTGYLFNTENELKSKMKEFFNLRNSSIMQTASKTFLQNTFSYEKFKQHVIKIFLT